MKLDQLIPLYKHDLEKSTWTEIWKYLKASGTYPDVVTRYRDTANSPFFDFSHMVKCVREIKKEQYPTAQEAWGKLLKGIKSLPNKKEPVDMLPPLMKNTIDGLGGWEYFINIESDKLAIERSNFIRIYDRLLEKKVTQEMGRIEWVTVKPEEVK